MKLRQRDLLLLAGLVFAGYLLYQARQRALIVGPRTAGPEAWWAAF